MNEYDPSIDPGKDAWLEATESERLAAVLEFHENSEENLDESALNLHSSIHVIVENQLAMDVELLPETIKKLMRQGLDRHEAIHAIGAIICNDIYEITRGEKTEFLPKQYRRKLEKITAKRWRKGQY